MRDMIVFAMEQHWHEHTGLPQMKYLGSTKLKDGSGVIKHYRCQMCDEVINVVEPINVDDYRNDF